MKIQLAHGIAKNTRPPSTVCRTWDIVAVFGLLLLLGLLRSPHKLSKPSV